MTVTINTMNYAFEIELPATAREVSVRGFRIPVEMISTVRLDTADTTQGVPAVQCVSNPTERGE